MIRPLFFFAGLGVLLLALPVRASDPPGFVVRWGGTGTAAGKFLVPHGVDSGQDGSVYVADFNNHRIQKFTNDGVYVTGWGSLGKNDGNLESPTAVAVSKFGDVYVVDSYNYRICKFTPEGVFLETWGSFGEEPGQFRFPVAMDFDPDGNIYVLDIENTRVQKFTNGGHFLFGWGAFGSADGEFQNPTGIAVNSSGRVYIVDSGNRRVEVFTGDGVFLFSWGSSGIEAGQFLHPLGIDIDQEDQVYVTDIENHRVTQFDANGMFVTSWGSFGIGPGYFYSPFDVAIDNGDRVFVADTYNNYIQKFDPAVPPLPPRPDYQARILFHLTPPVPRNACANGLLARCSDAVVAGDIAGPSGPFYYAYLTASRGTVSSLAGIQFGISYQHNLLSDVDDGKGVDIFSWTVCADREFPTPGGHPPGAPSWPGPGSGNIITWNYINNCQFGDLAVAGYFYLGAYSPDVLRITPRPVDNVVAVADCLPFEWVLEPGDLGFVTFSSGGKVPGCNPCLMSCTAPINVTPTTWSHIKSLFN